MLNEETFVLVFAGDSKTQNLNRKLFEDVRQHRGRAELVSDNTGVARPFLLPSAPQCIHPILEILPVQMITLAMGARSGREPGRFDLATKITATE